jgi:hypothetical protein
MATLKTFSIPGMKLWFYPNDHGSHFHAKRNGEWEYRIKFQENDEAMFELKWQKTKKRFMSTQDKKCLRELVKGHRLEILKEWEQKVKNDEK